jgi:Uma2 family endonuclease
LRRRNPARTPDFFNYSGRQTLGSCERTSLERSVLPKVPIRHWICRGSECPERPTGRPIALRPDFICEVLSESNAATDQVDKFRVYAASGVPFYWIADPARKILTAYRLEGSGYAVALQAKHGEIVNAPPFDAVVLRIGLLFGDDPD